MSEQKNPVDEFMISEYETIASAHFDLHSGLRQAFRFYLGLVAVPFSVWAVALKEHTDIFRLPGVLLTLFAVIPILGLMMFLQMVHTRFDIILYTRAVNGVRAYFDDRAKGIGIQDFQQKYLKLPTDMRRPPYREGPSRAYWWQFLLMSCVDSAFVLILSKNFLGWCAAVLFATIWLGIHAASYYGLSRTREQNEIPGGDA